MKFKDYIKSPCELRYIVDNLSLHTPYSLRMLMDMEIVINLSSLHENYRKLELLKDITPQLKIFGLLCNVKDIKNSIGNIAGGVVLQETELFEIKNFAYSVGEISQWCRENGFNIFELPDLNPVYELLDPDRQKTTSFYIYNSYSAVLADLRDELRMIQNDILMLGSNDLLPEKEKQIKIECAREREGRVVESISEEEERVRCRLSADLKRFAEVLSDAYNMIGEFDILLAKALQIKDLGLSVPEISYSGTTVLHGLFHPLLKDTLSRSGIEYQPIDIEFKSETICITGANMGGKTVAIKSIGLSQILFQFGFGIPAKSSSMAIKDDVMFSIDESQNMREGLSSFAAEMFGINRIINRILNRENILALIDEPARTTNPVEGTALVASLIDLLKQESSTVLVTTHYDLDSDDIKRYRVKGMIDGKMNYQLVESKRGDVPKEALTIARSIGIDERWIELAEDYINRNTLT